MNRSLIEGNLSRVDAREILWVILHMPSVLKLVSLLLSQGVINLWQTKVATESPISHQRLNHFAKLV